MANVVFSQQEEELLKNHGRIVFDDLHKKDRITKIYKTFQDSKPHVDVQRAKYFTESFKETEGQPLVLRWAKALYNIAAKVEVYIDDQQLLAGRVGQPGKYGLIYPELDGCFLREFVSQVRKRRESPFEIAPADVKILAEEVAPYWEGKTYYDELSKSLPEDVLKLTFEPNDRLTSRYIVNETSSMRSALQWVIDYKTGINKGFQSIKEEAEKELTGLDTFDPKAAADTKPFLESMIIVSDAIILWAERHSKLARKLAVQEQDIKRREELEQLAEICARVPRYPARNFHEALQAQWFIQLFSRFEQKTGATISNGRMDQYLYSYYQQDIASGQLDRDQAKELFQCMWLGMAQYIDLYVSPAGVRFNEGYAHWEAVTIGGVDEEGLDAVNDLTYLFLEDKREFPLNYPDLAARIHSRSPERYLHEIAMTIKAGYGFPKLINDEEIIPLLVSKGADFASANDYAVSGCTEVRMPNLDTYTSPCPYINLGAVVELTLNNGRIPRLGNELLTTETGRAEEFKSWDEFFQAYLVQQKYLLKIAFEQQYIVAKIREKHFAAPLASSLHRLCRKNHQDLHEVKISGGVDLGYFDFIGLGTATDSLAAIRKNVYDDKFLTMEQLKAALKVNFIGHEPLRRRLQQSPAYGNDDAYADSIAKAIDRLGAEFAHQYAEKIGVYLDLRYVPVTSHIPFGHVTGAMPNGRQAGVALSDGSSASQGADSKGPTAVLLSNYHTKNTGVQNRASRLMNIKLSPASVAGQNGTDRLVAFIKSWRDLKLWHLQFNIINQETLKKARENPAEYRSLLVRVAGYSAYFVELTPELQDDIILRTEHQVIG